MPTTAATEERGRRILAHLDDRYSLLRGNWEVDHPEMVEGVLAMAAGREAIGDRYAALAGDSTYTLIELVGSEALALDRLASWCEDEHYPKRPLALADLHEGVVHEVRVTVSRGGPPAVGGEELGP